MMPPISRHIHAKTGSVEKSKKVLASLSRKERLGHILSFSVVSPPLGGVQCNMIVPLGTLHNDTGSDIRWCGYNSPRKIRSTGVQIGDETK